MALSGNFSLSDISAEFGDNTRPGTLSLSNFYSAIFGTAESGDKQSDFLGYGRPVVTNFAASTSDTLGGYVDIDFTLEWNNNTTTVIIQYSTNGGSTWTNHPDGTVNYSTSGNLSSTILMDDDNTLYDFRIQYYNDFISHSNDHEFTASDEGRSSTLNQWATPGIDGSGTFRTGLGHAHVEWFYGDEPSSFSLQESNDGGFTWFNKTLMTGTDVNWGTINNPKEGEWPNVGSGNQIRLRADAEGGVNASDWSTPHQF